MLVAHNENDNAQAFAVQEGQQRFTYTLPATRWPPSSGKAISGSIRS